METELTKDVSNALVLLTKDSSNALVLLTKDVSNAIVLLTKDSSNALVLFYQLRGWRRGWIGHLFPYYRSKQWEMAGAIGGLQASLGLCLQLAKNGEQNDLVYNTIKYAEATLSLISKSR